MHWFLCILLSLLPGAAFGQTVGYTDYATMFADLADATAAEPMPVRVTAFHAKFDPLLPGFYHRDAPEKQARLDAQIARGLAAWAEQRASFLTTVANFRTAFAAGQSHFVKAFPDYTLTRPVYLIQSFGDMDGGTRTIGGREVMLFGADVIARIHDATTIGPFLDHEVFHIYHARYFSDCDALWCSLWQEGLAVYVAARLNPGANDRQLMLTLPQPIRPAVANRVPAAMCYLRQRFDSIGEEDYASLFLGKANASGFPPRFGYLLGLMAVERIGNSMKLSQLAKLPPQQVKRLLLRTLGRYGTCPAKR